MRRTRAGFTLIELMIVVAIIAIIAAIAIPNLMSARLNANETAAISTLRNISSAQAQFQAAAVADADNDGTGEYGVFSEMSGAAGVRTDAAGNRGDVLNPPVLPGGFRTSTNGLVSKSGYTFQALLPATSGHGTTETTAGSTFTAALSNDLAETTWCAYAMPINVGVSGNRKFFVNQTGDLTASNDHDVTLSQGQAFLNDGGHPNSITGQVAVGTTGRDGGTWRQVN